MAKRQDKKEKRAQTAIEDLIAKINKKYGYDAVTIASDAKGLRDVPRIPIGIFELDVATGGGIQKGCVIEIFGPKQSAKSFIATKVLASAQKLCRYSMQRLSLCDCGMCEPHMGAFIDVEGTLNLTWAQTIGLDLDNLVLSRPEFGEQALDTAEDFLRNDGIDIVVLDSVAHISPMREVDGSSEDSTMGKRALIMNSACRKWVAAINARGMASKVKPIVILINHETEKIGSYGGGKTRPGGVGQEYASSLDIRVSSGRYHFDALTSDSSRTKSTGIDDKPWWVEMNFSIPKNKTYVPRLSGKFGLWLTDREDMRAGQTDEFSAVYKAARNLEICYKDEKADVWRLGNCSGRLLTDLKADALANEDEFWNARQAVIDAMIGNEEDASRVR